MRPGHPGQPDMSMILQQAQQMQQQLAQAQDTLATTEVTGQAGNGLVTVVSTGDGTINKVTIDAKVVDPEDVETLQDLVLGAIADAARQAKELQERTMGPLGEIAGGMGLPGLG